MTTTSGGGLSESLGTTPNLQRRGKPTSKEMQVQSRSSDREITAARAEVAAAQASANIPEQGAGVKMQKRE